MSDLWYRYDDMPPPLVVRVRVIWDGREFVAARGRLPNGSERWGEYRPGCDTPRPVTLAGEPDLWQPLNAATWALPLPEPVVPSASGRMTSERVRFSLVDEAEASELAREMESDRETARVSRETSTTHVKHDGLQWWRDASLVRYEAAPDITLRMVEGRLMRAVYNCGAVSHSSISTSSVLRNLSSAVARVLAELESNTTPDFVPRMDPTPEDESDFLTAMGWFTALNAPDMHAKPRRLINYLGGLEGFDHIPPFNQAQRVILRRARNIPLSFAEIGIELFRIDPGGRDAERRIHAAGERARLVFKRAVSSCWRIAMGLSEPPGNRIMAAIRERNREAKRRATA